MDDLQAWVAIAVGIITMATLLIKVTNGFAEVKLGQMNTRTDIAELKAEVKETRDDVTATRSEMVEMSKDLVWVYASTDTPARPGAKQ